jgi:hypothetical protein
VGPLAHPLPPAACLLVLRRERGESREKEDRPVDKDGAEKSVPPVRKRRKSNRERTEREEGELGFPKDLYINSENCRDLFVKQNFPIDLEPE